MARRQVEGHRARVQAARIPHGHVFKDEEDVFTAVFSHGLVARHPEAQEAAAGRGSPRERLLAVCRVMVLEPWSDMVTAPMGAEFSTSARGSIPRSRRAIARSR